MSWNLTMLVIHLIALFALGALYRSAPCWMQRLVVIGLCVAMFFISLAYALAMGEVIWWWHTRLVGLAFEHIAVLLYVFRIFWQGRLSDGPAARSPAAAR